MKLRIFVFSILFFQFNIVFAADAHTGMTNHSHNDVMLTEGGNEAFGTIQEVILKLNRDPNTAWNKVNLEALRQHLLDMNDMTFNIDVISQEPIKNGLKATIRPTTNRAKKALERIFAAHPNQLKRDTGWIMKVVKDNDQYILMTTSGDPKDSDKIRGLGYIGLMAYGTHHQQHHWAMATGKNPHDKHH
ncbi:conserved hypothetical protein [Psychromonas ingrahamii 37]|uniref:Uncharacterized protein n=1 Tax=Psychromonas ingrahamii (strain DSM 17664 / CCUG 51855 / 37) TaxID=357804 RepID=A1SYP6_PSYIN|nr:hypothetical protein [Psychromonas ingrahamii]ABM04611.1 conserved hypothetical protein [Psychromonas ingrahamii 37]